MKSLRNILKGLVLALAIGAAACTDAPVEDRFNIDATDVALGNGLAGKTDILIASNCTAPAVAVDDACRDWLSAEIVQRCLTLHYTQNETGSERTGCVHVMAGSISTTVTVVQPPYFAPKEGDFVVGEVYYEDGVAKGVVFWVDPADANNAKVVSLKRVAGPWSSAASPAELGAPSPNDGAANTAQMRQSSEYADGALAALTLCDELGEGWYWPAYNELLELFSAYNAADGVDFDRVLTEQGGDVIDALNDGKGDRYWSSTEYGAAFAYFVRVTSMSPDNSTRKTSTSNPRYLRCFKVFGKVEAVPDPCTITPAQGKVELAGTADASATVAVAVVNGHLASAEASPAASWLKTEIKDGSVVFTTTEANDSGAVRTAEVTLTAAADNGAEDATCTVTVTQAMNVQAKFTVGTPYEESGKVVGIVFWVSDDGQSAKIVSLDRKEKVAWSTEGTTLLGATSTGDGAANTATLKASAEAGSIPMLAFCEEHGAGWYWPAVDELKALFEAYNGTSYADATNAQPGGLKPEEAAARAAFDKLLTDNGGTAINTAASNNNGDAYIASTEMTATNCDYVRFGKKYVGSEAEGATKTGATRHGRCVKVVGAAAPTPEPEPTPDPCTITPAQSKVELAGTADATATVAVEVVNGRLASAEAVPAASWLKTEIKDSSVVFTATEANDSGAVRTAEVTLTAAADNGAANATCKITVSQQAVNNVETKFTVGTPYEENGKVVGIVFWVSDDGQSAKIVSLDRKEKVAWSTEGTTLLGATSTSDGAANTATLKASAEAGSIPMLAFCEEHGAGWYWPAIDELKALFETYNGTSYDEATNAQPGGITDAEKTARAAFDKLLTDNGGTALNTAADNNNGDAYIASTEMTEKNCDYVRFGKKYVGSEGEGATKTGTTRHGRCVKVVGKPL